MLRNKCMMTSLLVLVLAISNFVDAANQYYVVSFVAGQSRLGLVNVTQTDTGIQAGRASITEIDKTLGSTAVLSVRSFWDGDTYFDVYVTYAGNATTPIKAGMFQFNAQLKPTGYQFKLPQTPGQYHPLHLFNLDTGKRILATGPFGTARANNYVSYSRTIANIFANPDNRSPGSAAIAPDGGLASQMTYTGLKHIGTIARLMNGKVTGSPVQWLDVNNFQGYSQSLSNPIESTQHGTSAQKAGTRYVAYRNFRQPGTANSQSQVVIQNVDAITGKLKGPPRSITNFAKALNVDADKFQSIALSPDGGLIFYSAWDNGCKKQVLVAHRLENGSIVGTRRIILGCAQLEEYPVGVYGINIAPMAIAPFAQ